MPVAMDPAADLIFLMVQGALFAAGDVTVVESGVGALLTADAAVVGPERVRLTLAESTVATARGDAGALVARAVVHFHTPGVMVLPPGFGRRATGYCGQGCRAEGDENDAFESSHDCLLQLRVAVSNR